MTWGSDEARGTISTARELLADGETWQTVAAELAKDTAHCLKFLDTDDERRAYGLAVDVAELPAVCPYCSGRSSLAWDGYKLQAGICRSCHDGNLQE